MKTTQIKFEHLKKNLKKMGRVLVAFSGGVDSSFLLKVALDTLGSENVLSVTADSETYPQKELKEAVSLAKKIGLDGRHRIIKTSELRIKNFSDNPPRRCYHCKYELFSKLKKIARKNRLMGPFQKKCCSTPQPKCISRKPLIIHRMLRRSPGSLNA